jgi:DNA-binding NarL/FixJ family response regulator
VTKLRIFLADDHALVREGLKMLINGQSDMEIVGEAGDGPTALARIKQIEPDIAIIDIAMPGANGAIVTERLSKDIPGLRVLALTALQDQTYVRQLIASGASGYVLKLTKPADFLHAVRIVGSGGIYVDPSVGRKTAAAAIAPIIAINQDKRQILTSREIDLIQLIARGYSNKEIAKRLDVTVKTVETYKTRVMEKLGFRSRVQLIDFVIHQGWLNTASVG